MADGPHQIADSRSHGAYVPLGMLGAAGLILIALAALGALLGAGAPRSDGLTEGGFPAIYTGSGGLPDSPSGRLRCQPFCRFWSPFPWRWHFGAEHQLGD